MKIIDINNYKKINSEKNQLNVDKEKPHTNRIARRYMNIIPLRRSNNSNGETFHPDDCA